MSLASRLGWGVALVTLVAALVPAAALTVWSRDAEARRGLLAEEAMRRDLQAQAAAWSQSLREKGAHLAGELAAFPAAKRAGEPLQNWSGDAVRTPDLDLLWVLDGSGRVLACGHWPARAGSRQGTLAGLRAGAVAVTGIVVRNEDVTALVAIHPLPQAGSGFRLVVGLNLMQAAARAASPAAGTRLEIAAAQDAPGRQRPPGDEVGARVAVVPGGNVLLVGARAQPATGRGPSWPMLLALCLVPAMAAGSLAALFALRVLRPLQELDRMAAALADGRLDLQIETGDGGELDGLATTVNKMTAALRRQRAEMEITARLAAWRDAARRLAHEVKNPLAPIRMSVENLLHARQRVPERFDELFVEESRTILAEVDALSRLVDTFSRFARMPEPQRRQVEAVLPLQQVMRLHRDDRPGVELCLEPGNDAGQAEIDVDLIGQVLKNLVLNALAAVPRPGGRVTLACGGDRGTIFYQVRDNGPGIPLEIRPRLFEPRVTSRPGGTGLGLAVARQIVVAHHGTIAFETSTDGTCFTVILPREAVVGKET